jgi:predicted ribosomally synthesized peptide with SipW-like signal peptide
MDAVLDTRAPETPASADVSRTRRRSRMIRAILAGGLVLGVGAAVTLAAWNDSEYATGTFTAGTFDLEGSTDGSTFANHNPSDTLHAPSSAATLSFTAPPSALTLSPGDAVAAPFSVRLAAGTTNNGDVVIGTPTTTGTTTGLTYEIVRLAAATACTTSSVDSTGTSLITAGTPITAVAGPNTFALTKGATAAVAGAAQLLCIKVTAGATVAQGQTGTVTWKFTATSTP